VQDVEAIVAEIRAGLDTRSNAVSDRGDDAEVIDAGQASDNQRADDAGLKYDSDARYDLKAKQAGASANPNDLAGNTPAQGAAA
jgi:capsid protein